MTETERGDYPPAIGELLRKLPRMPLGPGEPDRSVKGQLEALNEAAFAPCRVVDRDMVAACRAGLWLAFGYLDESHTISQDLHTPEGSAWHAVMHRREPDAWNSKYWWRRVGSHPVLEQLRKRSPEVGYRYTSPEDFVDFCERVRGTGSTDEEVAVRVQQLEWDLLFAWSFERATGK